MIFAGMDKFSTFHTESQGFNHVNQRWHSIFHILQASCKFLKVWDALKKTTLATTLNKMYPKILRMYQDHYNRTHTHKHHVHLLIGFTIAYHRMMCTWLNNVQVRKRPTVAFNQRKYIRKERLTVWKLSQTTLQSN